METKKDKCPICLHDGNGLHLCRGGNLIKVLLEQVKKGK
jgi:hypothetical protein